jgi:hypothetical protein
LPRKSQDGQTASAEELKARYDALMEQQKRVAHAAGRRGSGFS